MGIMKWIKRQIYSFLEKHFFDGCSRYNGLEVRRASRTKKQARKKFASIGAPHAKGLIFYNPLRAVKFAKEHGFPLVLKPNFGTFSRGSFFPIRTWGQFWKAMFLTKLYWPRTVVEEYIEGNSYRVVVIKGKTMVVAHRTPPELTGDGKSMVSQLIDNENQTRREMKLLPTMYEIDKDRVADFIKPRKLDWVIPKGKKVEVGNLIALFAGGVLKDVDLETIPEVNHQLFQDVLNVFEAEIFGLDFIAPDITKSWKDQKCVFLEANSRPYLKMHAYPRWGVVPDLSKDLKRLEALNIEDADIF